MFVYYVSQDEMDILEKMYKDAKEKEDYERMIVEGYSDDAKEFGIDAIALGCYIASAYRWYDAENKRLALQKTCHNMKRYVEKSL